MSAAHDWTLLIETTPDVRGYMLPTNGGGLSPLEERIGGQLVSQGGKNVSTGEVVEQFADRQYQISTTTITMPESEVAQMYALQAAGQVTAFGRLHKETGKRIIYGRAELDTAITQNPSAGGVGATDGATLVVSSVAFRKRTPLFDTAPSASMDSMYLARLVGLVRYGDGWVRMWGAQGLNRIEASFDNGESWAIYESDIYGAGGGLWAHTGTLLTNIGSRLFWGDLSTYTEAEIAWADGESPLEAFRVVDWANSADVVFALLRNDDESVVLRSTTGGKHWDEVFRTVRRMRSLGAAGRAVCAGGDGGFFYLSEDKGESWISEDLRDGANPIDVYGLAMALYQYRDTTSWGIVMVDRDTNIYSRNHWEDSFELWRDGCADLGSADTPVSITIGADGRAVWISRTIGDTVWTLRNNRSRLWKKWGCPLPTIIVESPLLTCGDEVLLDCDFRAVVLDEVCLEDDPDPAGAILLEFGTLLAVNPNDLNDGLVCVGLEGVSR